MPQRQPKAYFVPLHTVNNNSTTVVSNLDTLTKSSLTSDSNIPQTISNLNTIGFWDAGDDTDYDETTIWTPPASGHLVKFTINIAALNQVTVRSGDDITFTTLTITLTERGTNNVLWSRAYDTGFAIQDAADEVRLFVASETVANQSIGVSEGVAINIRVQTTNVGDTANITWESGVVPFIPQRIDSASKYFSTSGIVFYIDRNRLNHE